MSGFFDELDEKKMKKAEAAQKLISGVAGDSSPVSQAASGAITGAQFGPAGAAIGGIAGAVMGAASAQAARKAHNAQVEAQKIKALGDIEERKQQAMAQALGSMGARMSLR
jgi:hypothetical protein